MQTSLLRRLNTALSKINGNTLFMEDRDYDEYFCQECQNRVYEDAYNHKKGCCYACFYKERA